MKEKLKRSISKERIKRTLLSVAYGYKYLSLIYLMPKLVETKSFGKQFKILEKISEKNQSDKNYINFLARIEANKLAHELSEKLNSKMTVKYFIKSLSDIESHYVDNELLIRNAKYSLIDRKGSLFNSFDEDGSLNFCRKLIALSMKGHFVSKDSQLDAEKEQILILNTLSSFNMVDQDEVLLACLFGLDKLGNAKVLECLTHERVRMRESKRVKASSST